MSMIIEGEYLGLPLPTQNEFELLKDYISMPERYDVSLPYLFRIVLSKRPYIRDIIENDKFEYTGVFEDDEVTPESIAISNGIEMGYEFLVGSVTYIHFLRSNKLSVEEFLDDLPKATSVLPVRKNSQFWRVYEFLSGESICDLAHEGMVEDSSEVASLDAGDYLFNTPHMESLMDSEIEKVKNIEIAFGEEQDVEDYESGFHVGVYNAIEMYIQSREQQILNKVRVAKR